jgi:hypothetical protein
MQIAPSLEPLERDPTQSERNGEHGLPVQHEVSGNFHELGKYEIRVGCIVGLVDQEDLHEALDDAASVQFRKFAHFVPYVYTLAHCKISRKKGKDYFRAPRVIRHIFRRYSTCAMYGNLRNIQLPRTILTG